MTEFIKLPGSDEWEASYNVGQQLDIEFPLQDAYDFVMMCEYNTHPEFTEIKYLWMVQEGEKDEEQWIWRVNTDNGNYFVVAGCDYTGWDCQSSAIWYKEI